MLKRLSQLIRNLTARLLDLVIQRLWYVLPHRQVQLALSPAVCMHLLQQTARPSARRLEHRGLFVQGRRYDIEPRKQHAFRMTTTRKMEGYMQRRITPSAVVMGLFIEDGQQSTLHLSARMRTRQIFEAIAWPTFFSSLIIYMPWHGLVVGGLVITLYTTAWMGHRYHAALEAHAMMVFIRKVLADHTQSQPPLLTDDRGDIVYDKQAALMNTWDQLYEEKLHQTDPL
ncbi:MAG: hypothetical protein KC546_00705 [Anaerolineae bacterium]|nr:hypothetical protein [Anaerolineae bacterium]